MTEFSVFAYRVFLSYSHHDKAWATWLQEALEAYRIDPDLVGRETPAGLVPTTLRPIFRNREPLAADDSLTEQTLAALQASQFLAVICSPNAARSRHVDEEIRRFKAIGRADRIIPVIVAGKPGDPAAECFPPALHFKLEPERWLRRAVTSVEPVVTDPRIERDGKHLVTHKVVARLLGLGLQEVNRYAEQVRTRQLRIRRNGVIAGLLALTLAYDGGLALARYELGGDETLLDGAVARATALMSKAVALSKTLGLPAGASLGLLAEAEERLRGLAELARETPQLRLRKAAMLTELARGYALFGDRDRQRDRATEADRLLARLAADAPSNFAWQRELALSYDQLGDLLLTQGRLEQALAGYRASRAIAVRLAAADADNDDRQRDLALSAVKVGDAHFAQGQLDDALASYHVGLAIGERLAAADRTNTRTQHGVLLAQLKIGDVLRLQGELDAALGGYRESRAIAERLVAADPANPEWQRALAYTHRKLGDALAQAGAADEALASYRAGFVIAERHAALDSSAARWRSELGLTHERIGVLLEARGAFIAALAEYRASLAIAGRLAAADPIDDGRQRDLALAHEHVGDVLRALGDLAGARAAYETKRVIISRLAAADPDNSGWQYELGTSQARIGFVLEAQGEFAAALAEYEACLAIVRRFAAADPDNAASQRDLAVSHGKLATNYHRLGKTGQALAELRAGRDIMAALAKAAPEVAQWGEDLAGFDTRIAALQGHAAATATAATSLTIAAVADPLRLPDPKIARPPVVTVKFDD